MPDCDDEYVKEILEAMPRKGLTREQFLARCGGDIAGGYQVEVDEAWQRYQLADAKS